MPADEAERKVIDALRSMRLPASAVEDAREELRRRLALPSRGTADQTRMKLQTRLERLKAQFEWGHIDEHEYRKKMDETRAQLALVPESDRIVAFDQVAAIVSSLPGAIDAASPARLKELIQMIVSRVTTSGRSVTQI